MAIVQFNTLTPGLVGVNPRTLQLLTTDNLATVTAAGYLNRQGNVLQGIALYPTDIINCIYSYDAASNDGTFAIFQPDIAANNQITLNAWENPGNVLLPVVDGDFANFNGTTGQIKDDGFLPSDAAKTRVVMASAAVLANHIACFSDVNGTVNDDAATAINGGNIEAGLSGTAGTLASYPATAARGKLIVAGVANTGNTNVTVSNAAHGQATVVSIPDGGQATANFILSESAAGQTINSGGLTVADGNITSGSSGDAGTFISFPATAANGTLIVAAVDAGAAFNTTISNSAMGQASVVSIPDPGVATANFLLDTGAANILAMQEFVGISEVLTFGTGTWTVTRIAQGNYVSRHTPGNETSIIGVDITPIIRVAANKGFRLDSFDLVYAIAANALDAHSVTLDRIAYANNVAVSVTAVPVTGALATATQANPYVTNVTVNTPAFDVTADSKYIIEVTVDNAAASEYDYYGIMLRFSQTIG
ncbi:MAG: hypothetical protein WC753_04740 [Candidatus Gracilibacteria bacterium]|jgi:hypothetical protein